MENVSVLVRVARQVEGEFIMIDVMRADEDPQKLKDYLNQTSLPQTTEVDGVGYVISYGVHENIPFNLSEQSQ